VFVPAGCERVDTGFYGFGHGVVRSGRLVISTRPIERGAECRVDLSVRGRSGARFGHVSFRGRHRRLAVALSPAGRRPGRRHGVVRIVTEERCTDTFDVWGSGSDAFRRRPPVSRPPREREDHPVGTDVRGTARLVARTVAGPTVTTARRGAP
jgi:hypothetical protein